MPRPKRTSRFVPIFTAILVAVAVAFVPWAKVEQVFWRMRPIYLVILLMLSVVYLVSKAVRFQMMLSAIGHRIGLIRGSLLYLSAQHFTFLPGGEFYRTSIMKRYAGVSVRQSSAVVILQGLIEGIGLLLVGVVCTFAIGKRQAPVVAMAVLFGIVLYTLRSRTIMLDQRTSKWLSRIPFVSIRPETLTGFVETNRRILSRQVLPKLTVISLVPILAGAGLVYFGAASLAVGLGVFQAATAYILSATLAYVVIIPGAGEGGMVGVLSLLSVPVADAVALTLLIKLFTTGINLIVGPLSLLYIRRYADG